jgi:hypothetical protein
LRTTFKSGAWVEHLPIQDLKGKHRRDLDRVGKPQPVFDDRGEFDQQATMAGMDVLTWMGAKRDAMWAMIITGWSYDLPVPRFDRETGQAVNADSFGELPLEDFEELEALMEPFEARLSRTPDPKAATTSSSNGSSRASAAHGSRKG